MNEKINYGYVISWVVVATIGMYVFGYSLSSFNIMTNYMYYHYKYNNIKGFYMKDINVFNSIITSVVPIGAAIGALFGGKLASIGRRESAIVLSVGSICGCLSTIALNFYFLVVGRFAIGLACGATSVVIPMLVSEFPAVLSLIQVILLLFVFQYDTPVFYSKTNQKDFEHEVNCLIYKDYDSDNFERVSVDPICEESYSNLFTNAYVRAFAIGCCLSMIQQLSGINCIIFYSTDIFTKNSSGTEAEVNAKFGTFLVGLVNCASSICVLPLISVFGRKTLLLIGQYGMIICYLLLSVSSSYNMNTLIEVLTLIFVCFFELGVGTILWIYASETMTAKGMGIAILLNWVITIIWSFSTPFMFSGISPHYVYGMLMILCFFGVVFIHLYIIETKGLTRAQIDDKMNNYFKNNLHYEMEEKSSPDDLDFNEMARADHKNSSD